MARKAKLSENRKARFVQSRSMTRFVGTRSVRKRYLIVCEGAKQNQTILSRLNGIFLGAV